tara:strand:- start:435 stop:773 length:339 start_codon:yes stop_codon:yes gene_type:complete
MTTKTKTDKKVTEEKKEEKFNPSDYSCEVLLEKTTMEKARDPKFPSDAFNVTYVVDGKEYLDVTRSGKQVNVFDYYYDKYGKDAVQNIDWGYGNVNPHQYGYKPPEKKKRRK